MRLRVLSVAHTAVSRSAGRLRYLPLAADPDVDLHLVVPRRFHQFGRWIEADPPVDPDLRVTPMPIVLPRVGPALWYMHAYPGLGRVVRSFEPDVVHLWEEPWSLVALHACVLARRSGAAFALEVDQNILKRLPPPFEQIRRWVLSRTDLVQARSSEAADVVRACGYAGPTLPIGYCVDAEAFHLPVRPVTRPGPGLRIGYVGRLVAEKGLDDAVDALALARCDVALDLLGEGPHADALRARAAAAGVAGRVAFHPWCPPAGVASFMRGLDALILPTRTTEDVKEQFGRVIIEAQACGIPVIGSTCGAIPDVVGRGGWIVPERDPAALAHLFDRLAASPAERRARAAEGLANVASRYTAAAVARDLARGFAAAHAARLARHSREPLRPDHARIFQ